MHILLKFYKQISTNGQTQDYKLFALTITIWEQWMGTTDKVTYLSNKIQMFHRQSQTITDCFDLDGMGVVKYKPYAFFLVALRLVYLHFFFLTDLSYFPNLTLILMCARMREEIARARLYSHARITELP